MTVATPDNPMVQLGDFHFGQQLKEFELKRAMLLGWVTNNYFPFNGYVANYWVNRTAVGIEVDQDNQIPV